MLRLTACRRAEFGFHSTAAEVAAGVDLAGKTVLVTGANSGVGYETAAVCACRAARAARLLSMSSFITRSSIA